MPDRFLVANWKMNLPGEGIEAFMQALTRAVTPEVTTVVAPPFPYLEKVARLTAGRAGLAAQNCADHDTGAFTGEVSPLMVRDCGASYVILGHSERRSLYGETDPLIARKLSAALAAKLIPILCIGEDLRTREAGHVARFLADQIKAAAVAELARAGAVIIAYEPVWAIGSGRNASGSMVADTVAHIREALGRFWPGRLARETPILYGGSVTPDNIGDLVQHGRIDGFLVGGASLESARFLALQEAMRTTPAP